MDPGLHRQQGRGSAALAATVVLVAVLVAVSLCLTAYTLVMWRVALPSFDITDYHAFFADAVSGAVDWFGLWQRHNTVHLIALPKFVYLLDFWLGRGNGVLTDAVAALLVLATALLVAAQVMAIPGWSRTERQALAVFSLLLLTSIVLAESLLSPINIQWAFLAFGAVLLAAGLQGLSRHERVRGTAAVVTGALVSWLNAGLPAIMLASACTAVLLTDPRAAALRQRLQRGFWWLLGLFVIWEIGFAWILHWHAPFLALLYKPLLEPSEWQVLAQGLQADPRAYIGWAITRLLFLGRFVLVPFGKDWPEALEWMLVLFAIAWIVLVVRSLRRWPQPPVFFVYLVLFAGLMGIAAASRYFWLLLYSYRHANLGMLAMLSSLVLVYGSSTARYRQSLLALVLVLYAAMFMPVVVREAGEWSAWGREPLRELQIRLALGIDSTGMLTWVWKDDPADRAATEHSREVFREQGVGVFATEDYRMYAGELPLPASEVACGHRLLEVQHDAVDPHAWRLRGESRTADGRAMTRVQFRLLSGERIGYGLAQMPSHELLDQWRLPWRWGGYLRVDGRVPERITVIAFDAQRRCQPWNIPLGQPEPAP